MKNFKLRRKLEDIVFCAMEVSGTTLKNADYVYDAINQLYGYEYDRLVDRPTYIDRSTITVQEILIDMYVDGLKLIRENSYLVTGIVKRLNRQGKKNP